MILGIETSCDDTCAAVVSEEGLVLSNVVSSQAALHDRYGGVVPEVASRQHLKLINAVIDRALSDACIELDAIDRIAVTRGPGLIGALLVGITTAKGLAAAQGIPLVPVDHLHGHVAACFLDPEPFDPPFLCLVASGGHTLMGVVKERSGFERVGHTLDDAAGEALDKGARLLGLSYPGGAALDRLAQGGSDRAFDFPVAMRGEDDFSFSGLKTALVYKARNLGEQETQRRAADLAASYQRAVCDQLLEHVDRALGKYPYGRLALGGGVTANSQLRRRARNLAESRGVSLKILSPQLCTDNAAMIASAARYLEPLEHPDYLKLDAVT